MSTENEIKLAEAKAQRKVADRRVGELERAVEDEQKPKLRHGDYALWENGTGLYIALYKRGVLHWHSRDMRDALESVETYGDNYTILGNIFDDLKAISEPLGEFEMTIKSTPATHGTISVGQAISPSNLTWIQLKDGLMDKRVSIHMTSDELDELILKLRRKRASKK